MGVNSSSCATCRPGASKEWTATLFRAVRTADFGLARESLSNGADPNAMDEGGLLPLHYSVGQDNFNIVTLLLEAGADSAALSKEGRTAMSFAKSQRMKDTLGSHERVSALERIFSSPGTTPAKTAPAQEKTEEEANKEKAVEPAEQRLWTAALFGDEAETLAALDDGADVNAIDEHWAANNGNPKLVKLLVTRGSEVDRINNAGVAALQIAARQGHLDVVDLLLAFKADINKRTKDGWTALHAAARAGHLEVAQLLVERGADTSLTTNLGRTALEMAKTALKARQGLAPPAAA